MNKKTDGPKVEVKTAVAQPKDVTKLSPEAQVEAARAAQMPSEGVDDKGRPLNVITEESFTNTDTRATKAQEKEELKKALAAQEPFPPVDQDAEEATERPARPLERAEVSTLDTELEDGKRKSGKRYWLEISENVAGFMNFDPKVVFIVTENAEQEARLSRLTFEITKDEYTKRTKKDA